MMEVSSNGGNTILEVSSNDRNTILEVAFVFAMVWCFSNAAHLLLWLCDIKPSEHIKTNAYLLFSCIRC